MNVNDQRGARVQTHKRAPSLDLISLVKLLSIAIPAKHSTTGHPSVTWPLFLFDKQSQRIKINTRGVLSRLWGQNDFKKIFQDGAESGFLRDVSPPGRSIDAKVGGRVLEDNISELSYVINNLRDILKNELDKFLAYSNLKLNQLITTNGAEHLAKIANAIETKFSQQAGVATIVPLRFTNLERPANQRLDDVARVITAIEEVETGDWLEKFEDPARRKLNRRGLDEDDIDGALANMKREAQRLNSQVVSFLNFLDDEALSRVRLQVTFAIMEALKETTRSRKDEDAQLLIRYVENIKILYQYYCDTEHTWSFDISSFFGVGGSVNIAESLRMIGHYNCLPVWTEPVTQIFEFRPIGAGSLVREVSYRFRINGDNPKEQVEKRKSAFLSRLGAIEDELNKSKDNKSEINPIAISRSLTQLVFLAVVIPSKEDLKKPSDPIAAAQIIANEFTIEEIPLVIQKILHKLKNSNNTIDSIAKALIQTLRTKGKTLISNAEKLVREQYICVQEDVIDWGRLSSASGNSSDFFIQPTEPGQIGYPLWFKHLMITDNLSKVPGLLFSVRVRTWLRERSLTKTDPAIATTVQRQFNYPVLQITWLPYSSMTANGQFQLHDALEQKVNPWLAKSSIDIEYQTNSISRGTNEKAIEPEQQRQNHAATVTAFTILVYIILWLLREELKQYLPNKINDLHLLMLRFQEEDNKQVSDPASAISGSEMIYTIAHAVTAALGTESSVYMQGMILKQNYDQLSQFHTSGTFAALASAFPIHISMLEPPAVEKIGLISYATRPCDFHPAYPAADRFLYIAKSYIATAVLKPTSGYILREDRTQTYLQSREEFTEPVLILEEIGRLQECGCKHIMLLWHHYGNRRIGRTADRHSPHASPDFLTRVAEHFPDVTLYPLRRDVFPATRIRGKQKPEVAFEVQRVSDHEKFWHPAINEVRKDYLPFYTFATLSYVAKDIGKPQSGFCTYFLEDDSRLRQQEWAERARLHLIDPNQDSVIRTCLITVLRGLHFLHAERAIGKPVLDPFDWVNPMTIGGAGEFKVLTSKHKGGIVLSIPAVLTHIATVLRGRSY